MALTQQTTNKRTVVSVDFPDLPSPPTMTISKDQEAMDAWHKQLSVFYQGLRSVVLDKFREVQSQLEDLKGK